MTTLPAPVAWLAVVTAQQGEVVEILRRDGARLAPATRLPFGDWVATEDSSRSLSRSLGFPGQWSDASFSSVYNYFRWYDSASGRYFTPDRIGLAGGVNVFGYANGSPHLWIDPLGLANRTTDISLGKGNTGALDSFNHEGRASFELHVYYPAGDEVGIFGPEGWINKHGHKGPPEGLPDEVANRCKGIAIDRLRRQGRIPDRGSANIKGDRWIKIAKVLPLIGPVSEATRPSVERGCELRPNEEICD